MLHEVGDELRVLWVSAQQVNVRQKVEFSIRYGPAPPGVPESALTLCH